MSHPTIGGVVLDKNLESDDSTWKDMIVLYACDFPISGNSGRSRATRQKLNELSKKVGSFSAVFPSPPAFSRILFWLFSDIIVILKVFKLRPNVIISRGFCCYFSIYILKLLDVLVVREIHSVGTEEIKLSESRGSFRNFARGLLESGSALLDKAADMRIFNHPCLMDWYHKHVLSSSFDIYAYNGFSFEAISNLSHSAARKKFGFHDHHFYFVFVGSASPWHGADYLIAVQNAVSTLTSNVQIVIGGGEIEKSCGSKSQVINITPLNDIDCADLICAADACLLPVKDVRVSPGSPLKLYDYILHKKYIFAQADTRGYSDEVEKYSFGQAVDFRQSVLVAEEFLDFVLTKKDIEIDTQFITQFSWGQRMEEWLCGISVAMKGLD